MSNRNMQSQSLIRIVLKLGCLAYAGVLVCVVISNLSLIEPNWPFGLFASFSEALLLALVPVLIVCGIVWKRALLALLPLSVLAFFPVATFDQYAEPTGSECAEAECVVIVFANLRQNPDALRRFAASEAQDADVVVISELPRSTTAEDVGRLLPSDVYGALHILTPLVPRYGTRFAVLSKLPLREAGLRDGVAGSAFLPRQMALFELGEGDAAIRVLGVHPLPPMTAAMMQERNAYLEAATRMVGDATNFVMIGDFNTTPWDPLFKTLPGRRAGDPRGLRTWNARDPFQRLTIDHAMVGDGLEVVEASVLPDVGSDHYPIRIVVRRVGD